MVKGRVRCTCGRSGRYDDRERGQYPAGIQKEDLLWAYFVMRMVLQICEVLSDPELLKRIQDRQKSGPATMYDLAMMCCATRNPGAFQAAADATRAQNAAAAASGSTGGAPGAPGAPPQPETSDDTLPKTDETKK